jgi:hypothetical protein
MNVLKIIKKYYLLLFFAINSNAQFVGTPYLIPINNMLALDLVSTQPSFAFSTRKLREAYTGFAVRIRRSSDNAQADVSFDSNNIVSDNSTVTVAVAGGGLTVGSTLTMSSFRSSTTLYVTTWYDQSANGYNGTQSTTSRQPIFSIGVAGAANQYASLVFTGTSKHNVTVNQTLPVLLGSGLRGSVMMIGKVQAGVTTNNSFGYSDISDNNKRWSAHMNWPDNNNYMYTDLGASSGGTRNFLNDATVGFNKYKQYTIVRDSNSKTVRVSGINKNNVINLTPTSVTWSAGSTFGVGLTTGSLDTGFNQNGFTGNIPEFILFPQPLSTSEYWTLENNQIMFWGAN